MMPRPSAPREESPGLCAHHFRDGDSLVFKQAVRVDRFAVTHTVDRSGGTSGVTAGTHSKLIRAGYLLLGFLALLLGQGVAVAQVPLPAQRRPVPATNVTVDGSETMFTTMCALHAAGFEQEIGAAGWHPLRARLRDTLQKQQGPAVDAIRKFYQEHELADPGATLSRYVWFGLVAGPAPDFKPTLRHEELPPDVLALEGFSELLAAYYREQKIGQLWQQVQPVYQKEIERLHEPVTQVVFITTGYLREILDPANPRSFTVVVEPLVGRITNVRNFGDHYAIVLSATDEIPVDVVRHAFLHFLLDPLPLRYPHVVAVKRPLLDAAARAPRLPAELKDDFSSFFAECMVRAVDLKLRKMSPGERDAAMDVDDANGYILVRPLFRVLGNFEKAEPSMDRFFPEMVRAVDTAAEAKRLESVKFAAADEAAAPVAAEQQEVTRLSRRRAVKMPSTVPNDPEAIAALTEGERMIADKNARGAEAAFQKVLAKYPEQTRAWYGLGLVAMLQRDAARAEEVFGRLVSGEHAATEDPLVLAWSHVYLGRIQENNGRMDAARQEYQAALDVPNGPEAARHAAQKGLSATGGAKAAERP
jgi:tetratricopeptide (TPR) repeat protein